MRRRLDKQPPEECSDTRIQKSRISAQECRTRKRIRYQYLEFLTQYNEKAVLQLKREYDMWRKICKNYDDGKLSECLCELQNLEKFSLARSPPLHGDNPSDDVSGRKKHSPNKLPREKMQEKQHAKKTTRFHDKSFTHAKQKTTLVKNPNPLKSKIFHDNYQVNKLSTAFNYTQDEIPLVILKQDPKLEEPIERENMDQVMNNSFLDTDNNDSNFESTRDVISWILKHDKVVDYDKPDIVHHFDKEELTVKNLGRRQHAQVDKDSHSEVTKEVEWMDSDLTTSANSDVEECESTRDVVNWIIKNENSSTSQLKCDWEEHQSQGFSSGLRSDRKNEISTDQLRLSVLPDDNVTLFSKISESLNSSNKMKGISINTGENELTQKIKDKNAKSMMKNQQEKQSPSSCHHSHVQDMQSKFPLLSVLLIEENFDVTDVETLKSVVP